MILLMLSRSLRTFSIDKRKLVDFYLFSFYWLLVQATPPEPLSEKSFNYAGYVWDARLPFGNEVSISNEATMSACEIQCNKKSWCFSFNYNGITGECELIPTDLTLLKKDYETVATENYERAWVHRYLGEEKTKGCDTSKKVFGECISILVEEASGGPVVKWTLPMDSDGNKFGCNLENQTATNIKVEHLQASSDGAFETTQLEDFDCEIREAQPAISRDPTKISKLRLSVFHGDEQLMALYEVIGLAAPQESSISTQITNHDNTKITVSWTSAAYGTHSDVSAVRIKTEPNDGSCNAVGEVDYCEIRITTTDNGGTYDITGLTPGRVYEVLVQLYRTSDGAVSAFTKAGDTPRALPPPKYKIFSIEANDDHSAVWDLTLEFHELGEVSRIEVELKDDNSTGILVSEATFDADEELSSLLVEMGITGTELSTYSGTVTVYSSEAGGISESATYDMVNVILGDHPLDA